MRRVLRASRRARSSPSARTSLGESSKISARTLLDDRIFFWPSDSAGSCTRMSTIVAMCSLDTSRSWRSASACSAVGWPEFAVIIDARFRIFVIAVPIKPRASHQRPKDHDRRNTSKNDSALPMMDVPVVSAGISGQPSCFTRRLLPGPATLL